MTRAIRIEGNVAYVPLTRGLEAVIDAADVPLVEQHLWRAHKGRRTFYAVRTSHVGHGKSVRVLMHAAITGFSLTDHRDGNGIKNRRSNLRAATVAQNNRNAPLRLDNTTGAKGVQNVGGPNPFRARIRVDRSTISLGNFPTLAEAAAAYAKASAELHGDFGRTS